MKQILLPFGADSAPDVPIEAASQLAQRHNSQIIGIFYPRLPDPVIVDPMSGGVVSYDGLDDEIEAQKNSTGDLIRQRAAQCDPSISNDRLIIDMKSLSNWRQVGEICRVYDIAIIGRSKNNPHWQTLFEMALFEGGRPVLVVPPSWNGKFGETIGIAWNHSTETARVLALSMPIIQMAKKVWLLSYTESTNSRKIFTSLNLNDYVEITFDHVHLTFCNVSKNLSITVQNLIL